MTPWLSPWYDLQILLINVSVMVPRQKHWQKESEIIIAAAPVSATPIPAAVTLIAAVVVVLNHCCWALTAKPSAISTAEAALMAPRKRSAQHGACQCIEAEWRLAVKMTPCQFSTNDLLNDITTCPMHIKTPPQYNTLC